METSRHGQMKRPKHFGLVPEFDRLFAPLSERGGESSGTPAYSVSFLRAMSAQQIRQMTSPRQFPQNSIGILQMWANLSRQSKGTTSTPTLTFPKPLPPRLLVGRMHILRFTRQINRHRHLRVGIDFARPGLLLPETTASFNRVALGPAATTETCAKLFAPIRDQRREQHLVLFGAHSRL